MRRRVVATGMGVVSPVGSDLDTFWKNLTGGVSGIGPITRFDASAMPAKIAGEVKGFDPAAWVDKKEARRLDRFTQFGLAASQMAVDDSGIDFSTLDPFRVGVIVGSGVGGLSTLEEQHGVLMNGGPSRVSPFFIPTMIINMASGLVSMRFGARGPNSSTVTACSSGANALGEALRVIQHGEADVMITGGAEAAITPLAVAGFSNMKALSTSGNGHPEKASRPFDRDRDGFVIAEGAGILVLEELERAQKRGARIYAEFVGYGMSGDAYHMTAPAPDGEGAKACMAAALKDAKISTEEVDYINAHGTSTPLNDKLESLAVKKLLGDRAGRVPISSTKSMTGHLLGAAGGVEFIAAATALRTGVVPPTINYETPDPECDLDYVPNEAREVKVRTALSNSFGFGGHNVCLALRRFEG